MLQVLGHILELVFGELSSTLSCYLDVRPMVYPLIFLLSLLIVAILIL